MTTLVTGSNGFIGQHLLRFLIQENPKEKLYAIGRAPVQIPGVQNFPCDMTKEEELLPLIKKIAPQRIYHFAGMSRVTEEIPLPEYFAVNFLTTVALLNAIAKVGSTQALFFSSSVHVYGNQTALVSENTPARPISAYGFTKYLAEEALKSFVQKGKGLRVIVGRLYSCIGPGQPEGFVTSDLCRKLARLPDTKSATLQVGPLDGYRRFLDVRDAVQIFPKLLESPTSAPFEVFNVASPYELQVKQILEILLKISKKSPRVESSKANRNPFVGLKLDLSKLGKTLPSHRFRPIEESLTDIYSWATKEATAS